MGACQSEQTESDRAITREINEQRKKLQEEVKFVLLGPSEAGKSTIFKQISYINKGEWTSDELVLYKNVIFQNIINEMRELLNAMEELSLSFDRKNEKVAASFKLNSSTWSTKLGRQIDKLWNDKGVQAAFEARSKYYPLNDTTAYLFKNLQRYLDPNFVPTTEDILRARPPMSGIVESTFVVENLRFRFSFVLF
jgi:guanine nucleotide-binding protein G(i) subunit alpha